MKITRTELENANFDILREKLIIATENEYRDCPEHIKMYFGKIHNINGIGRDLSVVYEINKSRKYGINTSVLVVKKLEFINK